jgi:hypothetical protein
MSLLEEFSNNTVRSLAVSLPSYITTTTSIGNAIGMIIGLIKI